MSNPEQQRSRLRLRPSLDPASIDHLRGLPLVAVVYFSLHVAARRIASPAVDFDESELVFLSQWFAAGYNSQPPMYTWVQSAAFSLLGYSVFALALVKNLFLGATIVAIFATVRLATRDDRPAAVAAFGTLTIPQIAWESHRDLSHTVAVTFFAVALVYTVVRLARRPSWTGYAMIGLAAGFGMLSKYNFALVIVGVLAAAVSIPRYRDRLFDRRFALTVTLAIGLVTPHAIWLIDHLRLASSKTLATMGERADGGWLADVAAGSLALISCLVGCLALTLFLFWLFRFGDRKGWFDRRESPPRNATTVPVGRRHFPGPPPSTDKLPTDPTWTDQVELGRLLGRTLAVILGLLLLMILSGHATEFKNRWLQPFVVLVPAFLVVSWPTLSRRYVRSRMIVSGYVVMATVLVAIVLRPILSDDGTEPNQLNIDFRQLAEQIRESPRVVVASDMRIAGNLRLRLPHTVVLSEDHPHLGRRSITPDATVVFVSDRVHEPKLPRDPTRADGPERRDPGPSTERAVAWETVEISYSHLPDGSESATFHLGRYASPGSEGHFRPDRGSTSVAAGAEFVNEAGAVDR